MNRIVFIKETILLYSKLAQQCITIKFIKLIKLHLFCLSYTLLSSSSLSYLYLKICFYLDSLHINCINNSFLNYNYNIIFSFLNANSLSLISKNVVVIIVSNDVFKKLKLLKNLKENLNKWCFYFIFFVTSVLVMT